MSEFYPPTASSWLSGLRDRLIIGLSCFNVIKHSALFLAISYNFMVWSMLKLTIKPTPPLFALAAVES